VTWYLWLLLWIAMVIAGQLLVPWRRRRLRRRYERQKAADDARMARERELYDRALALYPNYPNDMADLERARSQWQEWIAEERA
jgi:hypothetical protein